MGTVNDPAHEWTDERLRDLERAMRDEYSQAAEEMRDRLDRALRAYSSEKAQRERALDGTEEAMKAHREWLRMQAIQQTRMGSMVDQLADAAVNANARAMDMVRDAVPTIYSENANRAAFDVDKAVGYDTKFTLVDESTVRALIGSGVTDSPILREVRVPKVSRPKDYQWNRQKFTSAVTQGILQGESIPDIVKRTRSIFGMNRAAAFRAARTATTSAECAGRASSYRRAERLGIDLMQEWMATVDPRTRPSHVALDGERVEVGGSWQSEHGPIRYPGDPQAHPSEVYNCRCTLVAAVSGIDQSAAARFSRLPEGMTYEGWRQRALDRLEAARERLGESRVQEEAAQEVVQGQAVVDGQDILGTWERRPDEFDFEIEDVLDAQGFDGKPRVVDADEFDRAVRAANGGEGLVMQRVYSAPDQETLDAYRESLYGGKWYVDCSHGNDTYGKGMYTASSKSTSVTQQMTDEIAPYRREFSYTETMTLDPSARVTGYNEVVTAKNDASVLERAIVGNDDITDTERAIVRREVLREYSDEDMELARVAEREWDFDDYMAVIKKYSQREREFRELGTSEVATLLGYDAVEVPGLNYTVVLNRTKLIIRRPE